MAIPASYEPRIPDNLAISHRKQMSSRTASGRWMSRSPSRHSYQDIHIGGGKGHLVDTFHFGEYSLESSLSRGLTNSLGPESPLNRLPCATDAPFNSYTRQHEPTCLPNTRVDLLREIYSWADREDERRFFLLHGLAGTGKSTISRTVARRYFEQQSLGASFFFSRGGGDVGNASKFVTSIAVQLATSVPTLHRHVCGAITERPDIAKESLRDQWHQLVLRPLLRLDRSRSHLSYIVVIDALDECDDSSNIRTILQFLAEIRSLKMVRIRVFLTSRSEIPIRYGFYQIPDTERQDFILHSISPSIADHDISVFLEYYLTFIGQERSLDANWPGENVVRSLVRNAGGLFIWAATACRFISEGKRFAAERLRAIIDSSTSTLTAPEKHLNEIYITVLNHTVSDYTNEKKDQYRMLRYILGSIVILHSPLSVGSLARLVHTAQQNVEQTLQDLHAILDIPEDSTLPIRLYHPSFRDFLLDKKRYGDLNFWVDERQLHQTLAESCIKLLSNFLKQDICGVEAPGVLVTSLESSQVEKCLPPEIQYACLYWIPHLRKGGARFHDNGQFHQFLQQHLLHWLEALSWMQRVSEGIHAISLLDSIALVSQASKYSTKIANIRIAP
jgi:hypothetical protein